VSFETAAKDVSAAAIATEKAATSFDVLLNNDTKSALARAEASMAEVDKTLSEFRRVAANSDKAVTDVRDAINRVSNSGLTDIEEDAIILRVDRPTVPRPLAGRNVIVSPSGNRILTASGAEWAEKVPDLIQGSIMDVFSSRAGIVGVLPVSGARTELRIHLNVRNFEAVYDQGEEAAPLAIVRYTATLANDLRSALVSSAIKRWRTGSLRRLATASLIAAAPFTLRRFDASIMQPSSTMAAGVSPSPVSLFIMSSSLTA